jgi:hypothetical protein
MTQERYFRIRARLYASLLQLPKRANIQTHESGANRFPLLEGVLSGLHTQPFIHDCAVTVYELSQAHTFRVFCKNHQFLPTNKPIKIMEPSSCWRGDLVVMRSGKKGQVVNMRGRDAALADFLVRRCVWLNRDNMHAFLKTCP